MLPGFSTGMLLGETGAVVPVVDAAYGQGALVVKSSNQSIATGSTTTVATWGSEVFDTGSFWSAGDPTKLVVPANGFAQVYGGVRWDAVTSDTSRFCRALKNGAEFAGGSQQAFDAPSTANASRQCFFSPFVPVVAGDEFTMDVGHFRGSALNLMANDQTYFGIRFLESVTGTLLGLTSAEAFTANVLKYVPWDTAIYDTLGAWSAGDPTKLTVPADHPHKLRLYAGARWQSLAPYVLIDIDRDSGSRPGGTIEAVEADTGGGFGPRQSLISALFRPEYESSVDFPGDSVPNDYLMQGMVGATMNLNTNGGTYFAMESVPDGKETLIRLAAAQSIGSGGSQTVITWGNRVEHDDYGIFDSGQSDRLIVPAGYTKALLIANISWEIASTGDRWIEFWKNGSTFPGGAGKMAQSGSATDNCRLHIATLVPCAEGDYFQVAAWQNSGSARDIVTGSTPCFGVQFFP